MTFVLARRSYGARGKSSTAARSIAGPNIDIQIERWPIERLIPQANNPRTHSREQVAQIAASIREFGWTNPVLVDANDEILAGHARVLAAKKLGRGGGARDRLTPLERSAKARPGHRGQSTGAQCRLGRGDAVPEVQPDPVARPGDLFVLGDHRVICGDCTQPDVVARLLGDAKPLLLITDPPYGNRARR
jgi:hypothetical protein